MKNIYKNYIRAILLVVVVGLSSWFLMSQAEGCGGPCDHYYPSPTISPTPIEISPTPDPTPTEYIPLPDPTLTQIATPSASPTPENNNQGSSFEPEGNKSTTDSPSVCEELDSDKTPANFHILRNGTLVITKWVPDSQFSEVVIWYGHNGKGIEYATVRSNTGYEFINVFDYADYTFWSSYKNGCEVGKITESPVVDNATDGWVMFRQASY